MNKINILLFYAAPSPRHQLMIRTLKEAGYFIRIISWNRAGSNEPGASPIAGWVDEWHQIDVKAPTGSRRVAFAMFAYYCRLLKTIWPLRQDEYFFIGHYLLLPVGALLGKRCMYDACEMFSVDLGNYFPAFKSFFRSLLFLLEGLMVRRLGVVTCVDSKDGWLKAFYRKWNSCVEVIWNLPSKTDDPDSEKIAAAAGMLPSAGPVIAYAGGVMRAKGLWVALEAAARVKTTHPDCLFVFIGPLKDDENAVAAFLQKHQLEDSVCILGSRSYQELQAILHNTAIGLALHQPNSKGIFNLVSSGNGRKFFTYMQAGVAVIGPLFEEVGQIVRLTGCGVLVDTGSTEKVAEAIIHLIAHPKKAKDMAVKGRRAFEQRFNWEIEKNKLVSIFNHLNLTEKDSNGT